MKKHNSINANELIISTVLQAGVLISSVIILVGIILFFTHIHSNINSYKVFTSSTYYFPHSISTLESSIRTTTGVGFIQLGVLLLILTPILRVATSILLFKHQKDRPMMLVTLFVLVVLVGSFIVGVAVK